MSQPFLRLNIRGTFCAILLASTFAASYQAFGATPTGATLVPGPISRPVGFMKSVADYGAIGDGVTDDTAALKTALSDGRSNTTTSYNGAPKGLYFPPGTYLIHDTLVWNGCCVTLQGAGSSSSIIRLVPSAAGFGSATTPKAMIQTPAGVSSFRQDIWDLELRVGANNAGAVALDYVSNNVGSIRNVNIVSEDGRGFTGIGLLRFYPGPLLIKDVAVTGFQYGLTTAAYEYGPTLEGITLNNQTVAGIYNKQQTISIRNLLSTNAVPAVINSGGMVLLLDGELRGGSSQTQAIQNSRDLYARNVQSSGYSATLLDTSYSHTRTVTGMLNEYVSGTTQTLRGSNAISLNLPVDETPVYADASLGAWAQFKPSFYGDTKTLQALLNSGASTICFPFGHYLAYNEAVITVPDTVKRIIGFSSVVNGNVAGINGGGIRFVVSSNSSQPLIIEQFGYGVKVDHVGSRPVAIKEGAYTYNSFPGSGQLFLEDIIITHQLIVQPNQQVWARQLNDEVHGTKIINNGTLWMLGLKTENDGTVISTGATGRTELLGNLIYPAGTVASSSILLQSATQAVSYIYSQSSYCSTCGYATQISEIIAGVNMEIKADPSRRYSMALYHGQ